MADVYQRPNLRALAAHLDACAPAPVLTPGNTRPGGRAGDAAAHHADPARRPHGRLDVGGLPWVLGLAILGTQPREPAFRLPADYPRCPGGRRPSAIPGRPVPRGGCWCLCWARATAADRDPRPVAIPWVGAHLQLRGLPTPRGRVRHPVARGHPLGSAVRACGRLPGRAERGSARHGADHRLGHVRRRLRGRARRRPGGLVDRRRTAREGEPPKSMSGATAPGSWPEHLAAGRARGRRRGARRAGSRAAWATSRMARSGPGRPPSAVGIADDTWLVLDELLLVVVGDGVDTVSSLGFGWVPLLAAVPGLGAVLGRGWAAGHRRLRRGDGLARAGPAALAATLVSVAAYALSSAFGVRLLSRAITPGYHVVDSPVLCKAPGWSRCFAYCARSALFPSTRFSPRRSRPWWLGALLVGRRVEASTVTGIPKLMRTPPMASFLADHTQLAPRTRRVGPGPTWALRRWAAPSWATRASSQPGWALLDHLPCRGAVQCPSGRPSCPSRGWVGRRCSFRGSPSPSTPPARSTRRGSARRRAGVHRDPPRPPAAGRAP